MNRKQVLEFLQEVLCDVSVTHSLESSTDAGTWLNECDLIDQDKLHAKLDSLILEEMQDG